MDDRDNGVTGAFRSTVGSGSKLEIKELGQRVRSTTLRFKDSFAVADLKVRRRKRSVRVK